MITLRYIFVDKNLRKYLLATKDTLIIILPDQRTQIRYTFYEYLNFEYFPNGGRNFKAFGSVPDKILEGLKQQANQAS